MESKVWYLSKTVWVNLLMAVAAFLSNFVPSIGEYLNEANLIMVFSFFISLYREIVKDIEDAEGDRQIRARTIPILTGVEIAKAICGVLAIVILILLFYWIKLPFNSIEVRVYILIAIILPLSYSVWLLRKAKSMTDLSKLSNVIKLIMLTGIAMLFFYL